MKARVQKSVRMSQMCVICDFASTEISIVTARRAFFFDLFSRRNKQWKESALGATDQIDSQDNKQSLQYHVIDNLYCGIVL